MYKIEFEDDKGKFLGSQEVGEDFLDILESTNCIQRSLKCHITGCFVYTLQEYLPEGSIAELGVYQGGITKFLATLFPERKVWAFDTFEGMPALGDVDEVSEGQFADVNGVLDYLDNDNIVIKKGVFPATTMTTHDGIFDETFALVHLDADLYQSTYDGLNFFWPRMVPSGVIILDDFEEQPAAPGVKKAFDDFFAAPVTPPEIVPVLADCGVVAIRKTL